MDDGGIDHVVRLKRILGDDEAGGQLPAIGWEHVLYK